MRAQERRVVALMHINAGCNVFLGIQPFWPKTLSRVCSHRTVCVCVCVCVIYTEWKDIAGVYVNTPAVSIPIRGEVGGARDT